jgi:uncharacterized membrane protein YozB (DUF420 family)
MHPFPYQSPSTGSVGGLKFNPQTQNCNLIKIRARQILYTKTEIPLIRIDVRLAAIDPLMLLAFQGVFLVLLFVSMAFRMRGNSLAHGVIMIVAVAVEIVGVVGVSASSILSGESMEPLMNPFSTLVVFGLHGFFGVVAIVTGGWLVALWRPRSTDFVAKSRRIWQITVISWVLAFVVGILLYVAVTTTLL